MFAAVVPKPVAASRLIGPRIAAWSGRRPVAGGPHGLAMLSRNGLPTGTASIATAYAGHLFGGISSQPGVRRAILLGKVLNRSERRYDLQ